MFTGIIQTTGQILDIRNNQNDVALRIGCDLDMTVIDIGASISCSGCCLTVTKKGAGWFTVDVSAETLSKTTLGKWQVGEEINLETSLKMGDELGGHFVFGHVDGLARLISVTKDGESRRLKIEVPKGFEEFVASKGSVAIDGISLTVNEVEGRIFGVNIIPHSWKVTTLRNRKIGDSLNFEVDMLARYVERQIKVLSQNALQPLPPFSVEKEITT